MQKCECDGCVDGSFRQRDENDKKEQEQGTMTCVDL